MRFSTIPPSVTFTTSTAPWACTWPSSLEKRTWTLTSSSPAGGRRWGGGERPRSISRLCNFHSYLLLLSSPHTPVIITLPPLMYLPSCRLCSCSAAWPPAATSAAACAAAVTAAVENVNHGLGRARNRTFTCPPRTWRPSCSLTREVMQNHLQFLNLSGGKQWTRA